MQMSISAKSREKKAVLTQAKQLWQENYIKTQVVACAAAAVSATLFQVDCRQVTMSWNVFRLPVLCDVSSRNTPCTQCRLPLKRMSQKHSFPVDMQHTDFEWKKKKKKTTLRIHRQFELFTSRWVSSCCSANSYEPENGPIKSPWVLLLCLQSIPFTVGEAAPVDYNIAAVHAKNLWIKEQTGMCALWCSSFGRDWFINQKWSF